MVPAGTQHATTDAGGAPRLALYEPTDSDTPGRARQATEPQSPPSRRVQDMRTPAPPRAEVRQREARAEIGPPIVRQRAADADDGHADDGDGGTAEAGYSPFTPGRGREVDQRLQGASRLNPANRERPATRSTAASVAGALLAGGSFLLAKAGAWALSARTGPEDPPNQRTAYDWDRPNWRSAESVELSSHAKNNSWTDIDRSQLPAGRRLVKFTWVYKKKRNGKFKARLCVQGCTQVPGVDFDQTHCATMRASSLRVLCALGAGLGLRMLRWDFASAYLQGSLFDG